VRTGMEARVASVTPIRAEGETPIR